jgi:hypothetical protein
MVRFLHGGWLLFLSLVWQPDSIETGATAALPTFNYLWGTIHEVPGDEVWINKFNSEVSLRKSYVIALLRSRQLQRALNVQKAAAMRDAENALIIGGATAVAILIYQIFS